MKYGIGPKVGSGKKVPTGNPTNNEASYEMKRNKSAGIYRDAISKDRFILDMYALAKVYTYELVPL